MTGINLKIGLGERVALIGHNGAGKTTLLRVLTGIYPPQAGRIAVNRRVTPLFDLGLGVDPEILLVDEGVGAGDAAFPEKANQRLSSFIARAGVLLLASHSGGGLLAQFCTPGIRLEHGRLLHAGLIDEVLARYEGRA